MAFTGASDDSSQQHGSGGSLRRKGPGGERIRFAVVGLGYISQAAVLPAFAHTGELCTLTALVSSDAEKLNTLGEKYNVVHRYTYEQYDECLNGGHIDAVYIALPNSLHCEYAIRAAQAGIHVLCEKPMAINTSECLQMIEAADENNVKLMIAYRLHFEEANMQVVEQIAEGSIGDPVYFSAAFSQQVKAGNIRTSPALGGGVTMDMGIYCINAARYIFRSEPRRVSALTVPVSNEALQGVDALTGAVMEFDGGRLASFVSSFAAADASTFTVVGSKGLVRVDPAFDFQLELATEVRTKSPGRRREKKYSRRDQFAPELIRFTECILEDTEPEPSGAEGLADVRIIEAINDSARTGRCVELPPFTRDTRPVLSQVMSIPGLRTPELINAASPGDE